MKIALSVRAGQKVSQPEDIWSVEDAYAASYAEKIAYGAAEARRQKVAIVAIARNAMPHLRNTLRLVEELAARFKDSAVYVFENDSTDDTAAVLDQFAATRRQWVTVEHDTLGGEDARGFQPERTIRLAGCRGRCQEWVRRHASDAGYVVVLDADPHGGYSVDGVLNSLGWFCELAGKSCLGLEPGAMASTSIFLIERDGKTGVAHYDAWAARLNTYEDRRDHTWFHMFVPPTGSTPIPFLSAFGGLCLYKREAFLAGRYEGGDCEHVAFHRTMRKAGYQLYLNPGSRYVAILP